MTPSVDGLPLPHGHPTVAAPVVIESFQTNDFGAEYISLGLAERRPVAIDDTRDAAPVPFLTGTPSPGLLDDLWAVQY